MHSNRTATGEPTFLVELARVRQVDLRHNADHFAIRHDKGAVEQVIVHFQRAAN